MSKPSKQAKRKPPKRERTQHNFTFDPEVWRKFKDLCEQQGRARSTVIEKLMEKYVNGQVKWED